MERRQSRREEIEQQVKVTTGNHEFMCDIVNMSFIGALLLLTKPHSFPATSDMVGTEVHLEFDNSSLSRKNYDGVLRRIDENETQTLLAIRFN